MTTSSPLPRLAIFLLTLLLLGGCSLSEEKLKPGRCNYHTDCPDGFRCNNTYCEDIYHPRREIKPY